jgi:hypothetical protein
MEETDIEGAKEEELFERMAELINEFAGEISYPAALGVLELVKDAIKAVQVAKPEEALAHIEQVKEVENED